MSSQDVNYLKYFLMWSFFIICFYYGSYKFTTGLIPLDAHEKKNSSFSDLPPEPFAGDSDKQTVYNRHYDKVVFVLIDGLRADFVQPTPNHPTHFPTSPFPYLQELIKSGNALAFSMKAYSPTVTLPRIKSLISGTLAGFSDVLTNFNAKQMVEDNWVSQAARSKLNIVFYGDNTWVKLFPKVFHRFEGVNSFYVFDYIQVDNNVTKHMEEEMEKQDWDIMILHYLGVDHIGHSMSASSSVMRIKLREMDEVIHYIYENIRYKDSLIIVCGDHGMTSSGNHGGDSDSELWTPLVFINSKEYGSLVNNVSKSVSQLDVATTISVLLGLPIPANSMGSIIPEALHFSGFSSRQVLYSAFYNLHHLTNILRNARSDHSIMYYMQDSVQEIISRHHNFLKSYLSNSTNVKDMDYLYLLNSYTRKLHEIKDTLIMNSIGYNSDEMIAGIAFTWISLLSLCSIYYNLVICVNVNPLLRKKNLISVAPLVLFFVGHYVFPVWVTSAGTLILTFFITIPYSGRYLMKSFCVFNISEHIILFFFLFNSVLSLLSSSFIEEEHQVWYFISTSMIFILLKNILFSTFFSWIKKNPWAFKKSSPESGLANRRRFLQLHKQRAVAPTDNLNAVITVILLLLLCRILRSWNQTGDKWSHLPDTRDWLLQRQNTILHRCVVILSEITIFIFLIKDLVTVTSCISKDSNFVSSLVVLSALMWTYVTKCHKGLLKNMTEHFSINNETVLGARIVFCHVVIVMLIACIKRFVYFPHKYFKSYASDTSNFILHMIGCWVLFAITLIEVENIPVLAGILVLEHIVNGITWRKFSSPMFNMFMYVVMAMCSHFYMGNSNTLSTINVFAGYAGLTDYQPWITGFLILCHTYSCMVVWLMFGFYRLYMVYHINLFNDEAKITFIKQVMNCCLCLVLYRMFVLSVYMCLVYIQRYHLFIMSVFLPKLLYEISHTFIFTILSYVILLVCL